MKLFRRGIQMMKLKGLLTTGIAADDAFSARFLNKRPLDRSPPSTNPFRSTSRASVIAPSLEHESGFTVTSAPEDLPS
jgi:hypothetical protein